MMKMNRIWHVAATFLLVFFGAVAAHAQHIDPTIAPKARGLYDEAAKLMAQENYSKACPKFEEVTKLIPQGVNAQFALGYCYEKSRQWVRAWLQYRLAETIATEVGRAKEAQDSRNGAARVGANLILVMFEASDEARRVPGLSVTWDGINSENSTWGNPIPIETGKHVIKASAPSRQTWSYEVTFEKGGITHEIKVPVLEPVPEPRRIEPPNKPVVLSEPPIKVTPATESNVGAKPLSVTRSNSKPVRAWMRPVGIGAVGLGIAGFVVGGALGGLAISRYDKSVVGGYCDSRGNCNQDGVELRERMTVFADGSTWSFIAGGLVLATGVTLLIEAPRSQKEGSSRIGASWQLDLRPGGVGIQGVW